MHSTRMTDVGKWKWMRTDTTREEPSMNQWWHCAMKHGIINLSLFLWAVVNKQPTNLLIWYSKLSPKQVHKPAHPPCPPWPLLLSWKRPPSPMAARRELMTSLPPLDPVGELPILSFSMLPSRWCKSLTDYLYLGFTTLRPTLCTCPWQNAHL